MVNPNISLPDHVKKLKNRLTMEQWVKNACIWIFR